MSVWEGLWETLMEDICGCSEADKEADGFITAFYNSVTTTNNYQAIKAQTRGRHLLKMQR